MKRTLRLYLSGILITFTALHGAELPTSASTPEHIVATLNIIQQSDNSALDPLKDALADVGSAALRERRGRGPDDAAFGAAQRITPPTPFSTPSKLVTPRDSHRPTSIHTPRMLHDNGVGIGNFNVSHFDSLPDQNSGLQEEPFLQEEIAGIQDSIARLEALSDQLLNNKNQLSEQERQAIEFINKNSKQASYANPRIIGVAALGAVGGALAWAARIDPFRIYQKECTKFTGLEMPALIAAGKALIGPVVAIIGIGILWYKFKQWIVEPYREAQKAEIKKFQEELTRHKTETEKTHRETLQAITNIKETIERAERGQRAQLEHTLKTLFETENQLKQQIAEFTAKATANIASIADNIHDLQGSRNALKEQTSQLIIKHEAVLKTIQTLKDELAKTSQTLKAVKDNQTNILRIMDRVKSTSPASAPVVGGRSPSPGLPIPHSAQITGTERRSWFGRRSPKIAPSPSSQLSPAELPHHLRINTQTPSDGESGRSESKRTAPISAPTPTTD